MTEPISIPDPMLAHLEEIGRTRMTPRQLCLLGSCRGPRLRGDGIDGRTLTMDPTSVLADTRTRLTQTRTRYSRTELKLAQALPMSHAGDLIQSLVGHTEEFGLEATARLLRSNPRQFGLTPAQAEAAIPYLAELSGLNETIDRLAAEESRLRRNQDPSHRPVYYAQNQPFTVADDGHQVTFTETGETVPLVLVEPKSPEPEPTPQPRLRRRMRL